jgi:hypothetical protein
MREARYSEGEASDRVGQGVPECTHFPTRDRVWVERALGAWLTRR